MTWNHAAVRTSTRSTFVVLATAWLTTAAALGQIEPPAGLKEEPVDRHSLIGATVVVEPGRVLENATIIIDERGIVSVAENAPPAPGSRVWDRTGKTITAGFIDLDLRSDALERESSADRAGRHWNKKVHPELEADLGKAFDDVTRSARRDGFTAGVVAPKSGIFAGRGTFVRLHEDPRRRAVRRAVGDVVALEFGGWGSRDYPSSLMGAVALCRQTLLDATWYDRSQQSADERPTSDASLDALRSAARALRPVLFRARSNPELFAALDLAQEFDLDGIYFGAGDEYQWIADLAKPGVRMVVPIDPPRVPNVATPSLADGISLRDLEAWARGPENPARLERSGVRFAITRRAGQSAPPFLKRLREAAKRGASEVALLSSLTTMPASFMSQERRWGKIEAGFEASLVVFDGPWLDDDTAIEEVWVSGTRYPSDLRPEPTTEGSWNFVFRIDGRPRMPATVNISKRGNSASAEILFGEVRAKPTKLIADGDEFALIFDASALGTQGLARASGNFDLTAEPARATASGSLADGTPFRLMATRTTAELESDNDPKAADSKSGYSSEDEADATASDETETAAIARICDPDDPLPVPLGARGRTSAPFAPNAVVVRNATIWTSGDDGILENATLVVESGKVRAVGSDLEFPPNAHIIDGTGLHVTPGLIDAHSHTAIYGGVNEGTQAITAEVRIGDVVWPDDMNIYRQLAGGLTAAHLLHGSANPIGGQAQSVKWRWGRIGRDLRATKAHPTIKFALGENVKQSNWGDDYRTRYPQTRMGVEQIMRDGFERARRYEADRARAEQNAAPFRRDLELDTLAEILRGDRWIHCHSYRQDEILMLVRLCEDFGFRMGTFQHILEGYKVAPELAAHGAHGSSFSDWWAYKFEVYDAIPHNGALLHRAGVITSFNSDSNELARRMNLEAAKAVRYGGVPREEALCFVTLNAAIQIGLGDSTGSLEPGKDGDFALWSGDPLSTRTRCLETWIDGARQFSIEDDARLRERDEARRAALISAALEEVVGAAKPDLASGSDDRPGEPLEGECSCMPR